LIGLQLRPILDSLEHGERTQYLQIAGAVLATVVMVRLAWVFTYNRAAWLKTRLFGAGSWPGAYPPLLAGSLVVSWCGMRGIVTLAAAYALPDGFPYRDLILLCAFCVVVGTLIAQGLTLRPLILALKLPDDESVAHELHGARQALARVATQIIDNDSSSTAKVLRDEFVYGEGTEGDARNQLRAHIVTAQREALVRMRDSGEIGDDAFHQIEEQLDRVEINVR
jgi:CPA1 family monovalent cation:H+ antiporter